MSISNNVLPDILPAFKSKFNDVRIKIITGHSKDILHKVINKEVDFGIIRTETHPQVESIVFTMILLVFLSLQIILF
ncbi:LysR substrate-binding domain-containing protein [Bacillus salipaludis]|uniref:LysR substrate-binding domain-containing protein n=1 Tax=Bacillus salipaludis TaxID=2547811 RepID=UPI0038B3E5B1